MHFRPCIDIHNGKVKQIVGGSLTDQGNQAKENFTASENADYYAKMYQKDGLIGGHVILLNPVSSEYYRETHRQYWHLAHIQKDFRWAVESMPKMQKSFWRRGQAM